MIDEIKKRIFVLPCPVEPIIRILFQCGINLPSGKLKGSTILSLFEIRTFSSGFSIGHAIDKIGSNADAECWGTAGSKKPP